jgi:hypothetical protein
MYIKLKSEKLTLMEVSVSKKWVVLEKPEALHVWTGSSTSLESGEPAVNREGDMHLRAQPVINGEWHCHRGTVA